MKSRRIVVRALNKLKEKYYICTSKQVRDSVTDIGSRYAMNLNVNINLTESQVKQIEEQARIEVENAILNGSLDTYIKEVVKSCAKQVINEEIQTKGYRKMIADRVTQVLVKDGIVNEE